MRTNVYAVPVTVERRGVAVCWALAFAFLVVMAFATLPSPLYGLYRARDHLSTLTVTVVYAVFAVGTIAALVCERLVVARVLTGVAVGLAAGTATAYLIELRVRDDPNGSVGARTIGTAVNVGALG